MRDQAYITVTLEVSGYDDDVLSRIHAELRTYLRIWKKELAYGELTIAYQDREQVEGDAQVEMERPFGDVYEDDDD